jgi:hypothetical protein
MSMSVQSPNRPDADAPTTDRSTLTVHPMVSPIYGHEFAATDDLSEVFGRHVITELLAGTSTTFTFSFRPVGEGGVEITVRSRTEGLTDAATISHRLFFIDRMETRLRVHTVSPEEPVAETRTLVLLPESSDRDYFHASAYDARDRLLATQAVVFDRHGRSTRFRFGPALVSDVRALGVDTAVVRDGDGSRLRFTLTVEPQERARALDVLWESVGVIRQYPVHLEPGEQVATVEVSLGPDSPLCTGDWVLIAVDESERLIAQTLWTLGSAAGLG